MADKPIGKDATGYEILTDAMKALLNQYPGLYENETIKFEELGKESGIAFSADNGALVYSEKEDVCGVMHQVCQYPFYVVYRTASDKERQKLSVQKFLDNLGKWICREPVVINGSETRLNAFPELSQGRVIKRITRDNSYFTFHNVSINTWFLFAKSMRKSTLHSTMFLLIQQSAERSVKQMKNFTFHNVSINT